MRASAYAKACRRSSLVIVALSLGGCGEGPQIDLPDSSLQRSDAFETTDCWLPTPNRHRAECGYVTVQESGGARQKSVKIATMIVYGSGDASADPVVFLQGGPGASAIGISLTEPFPFERLLIDHDVILVDQRGAGYSEPALHCYSTDGSPAGCFERLDVVAGPLSAYNTRQSAADIDAVRDALGYSEWNVYGSSYGTRLALTLARDFPETVRSVIADGLLPLEADPVAGSSSAFAAGFAALAEACARQSSCDAAFGDISQKMLSVLDELDRAPVVVELGRGQTLVVTGAMLMTMIRQLLSSAWAIPYLPSRIHQMWQGDFSFLSEYLEPPAREGAPSLAIGLYYSVMCQDEVPFTSLEQVAFAQSNVDPHFSLAFDSLGLLSLCESWPVPQAPSSENEPVLTDVPTLIISGSFDPITPPGSGTITARTQHSAEVILADQGHGAGFSDCGSEIVREFLANPERAPDATCVPRLDAPVFEAGPAEPASPLP